MECNFKLGFKFPDGTINSIDELAKRYKENKEIMGKTLEELVDFFRESETGILINCNGTQNFISFSGKIKKDIEDIEGRVSDLEWKE